MTPFPFRCLTILGLAGVLGACKVGPDYQKPDVSAQLPAAWRWQAAAPRDNQPKGDWWRVFRDAELDRLEGRAVANNPGVQAAVARVDQARAAARSTAAEFFPDIRIKSSADRERTSGNLPTPVPVSIPSSQLNSFRSVLDLSYEIDLWGKVRRSFESARAQSEASIADYQGVLLTLTGDVASNYYLLRAYDAELGALRETIDLRGQALDVIQQRLAAGTVGEVDLARARTELATAKAEMADVKRLRQETADTLAVLCGEPASTFGVKERPISGSPPGIPAGLPADLLERRPDVASAERLVAARNAEVGVAVANYFPAVKLTGDAGFLSKNASNLFSADSKVWSIGPEISLPVTGYALIGAKVRQTKAAREEAIGNYRQAVLGAVKDVETSLTQIRYRREQAAAQEEALAAAGQSTKLIRSLYESGSVSYLELLDAERTHLQLQRQAAQTRAQRYVATVRLIKAMGGGWNGTLPAR